MEMNTHTGESQLPSGEYTRESVTNTNNSLNIRKISNSFSACLTGQGEVVCAQLWLLATDANKALPDVLPWALPRRGAGFGIRTDRLPD
jgi:hypothetical protein